MALIRQADAGTIARDAIVLDLGDVQRQAQLIMDQARRRAEEIVAEAKAERARLVAGGAEEGRAAGMAKGLEEGRRSGAEQGRGAALQERKAGLETLEKRWTEALAGLEAERDRMLTEARADVLRLALQLASKVVKRRIEIDPGVVVDQIDAVLQLVARPTELLVSVHPEDRLVAEAALPGLMARFQSVRHIELRPDATLARGSCVATTRARAEGGAAGGSAGGGEIEASVDAQLERMTRLLLPDAAPDAKEAA